MAWDGPNQSLSVTSDAEATHSRRPLWFLGRQVYVLDFFIYRLLKRLRWLVRYGRHGVLGTLVIHIGDYARGFGRTSSSPFWTYDYLG